MLQPYFTEYQMDGIILVSVLVGMGIQFAIRWICDEMKANRDMEEQ